MWPTFRGQSSQRKHILLAAVNHWAPSLVGLHLKLVLNLLLVLSYFSFSFVWKRLYSSTNFWQFTDPKWGTKFQLLKNTKNSHCLCISFPGWNTTADQNLTKLSSIGGWPIITTPTHFKIDCLKDVCMVWVVGRPFSTTTAVGFNMAGLDRLPVMGVGNYVCTTCDSSSSDKLWVVWSTSTFYKTKNSYWNVQFVIWSIIL